MIVFPQGGVLKMSTPVTVGQMLVLTNLKTGHDAICRIVKVRAYAPAQSYVEIEFTNRQQGYWGVQFAGEEAEPAKTLAASATSAISTTVRVEASNSCGDAEISCLRPPAARYACPREAPEPSPVFSAPVKPAAPEPCCTPNKPESSFVGIGEQEEVQPAASTTSFKTKQERIGCAPLASLSMSELRGDAHAAAPISASMGSGVPGEMTDLSSDLEETIASQQPSQPEPVPATAVFTPTGATSASGQKVFGARFDATAPAVSDKRTAPLEIRHALVPDRYRNCGAAGGWCRRSVLSPRMARREVERAVRVCAVPAALRPRRVRNQPPCRHSASNSAGAKWLSTSQSTPQRMGASAPSVQTVVAGGRDGAQSSDARPGRIVRNAPAQPNPRPAKAAAGHVRRPELSPGVRAARILGRCRCSALGRRRRFVPNSGELQQMASAAPTWRRRLPASRGSHQSRRRCEAAAS